MDFDKLHLNEFPTLTTRTPHNAAQWCYRPTEILNGTKDSLIFLQKKTKDNKKEAALNEPSRQHLSEELSLWGTHHLFVYASHLNCCTAENIHLTSQSSPGSFKGTKRDVHVNKATTQDVNLPSRVYGLTSHPGDRQTTEDVC